MCGEMEACASWLVLVGKKVEGKEMVCDVNRQGAGWECVGEVTIGKSRRRIIRVSSVMIRPLRSGVTMKVAPG